MTPNEFRQIENSNLNKIEARIDKALREGRLPVRIATDLFEGSFEDLEHVVSNYSLLGWKADIVTDWRDGNYVEIDL